MMVNSKLPYADNNWPHLSEQVARHAESADQGVSGTRRVGRMSRNWTLAGDVSDALIKRVFGQAGAMLPEPHTNVVGSKHQRDQQIDRSAQQSRRFIGTIASARSSH